MPYSSHLLVLFLLFNCCNIFSMDFSTIIQMSEVENHAPTQQHHKQIQHPLSPKTIANIIKTELLLSEPSPTQSEIELIEKIKSDKEQYTQLMYKIYELQSENQTLNEPEVIAALIFQQQSNIITEKNNTLLTLREQKREYAQWIKKDKKFWKSNCVVLIGTLCMVEFLTIILTGIGALNCWYS